MLRTAGITTALLSVTGLLLLGCPREQEPQSATNYPQQPGAYPQQPGAYPQQPGAYPQQPGAYPQQPGAYPQQPGAAPAPGTAPAPAPGGTAPAPANTAPGGVPWPFPFPFPGAQPAPSGSSPGGTAPPPGGGQTGGSAQPIDPMAAQVATIPLGQMAAQEAQGMQPVADVVAANFQQGQVLEQAFQLLPNKCYTVLGKGAGISELDIKIVMVTPLGEQAVAQDNTQGGDAVLGGRGQCYTHMAPIGVNAKAVWIATAGSGLAAGRIYVR